jgi:hypothetical protein
MTTILVDPMTNSISANTWASVALISSTRRAHSLVVTPTESARSLMRFDNSVVIRT